MQMHRRSEIRKETRYASVEAVVVIMPIDKLIAKRNTTERKNQHWQYTRSHHRQKPDRSWLDIISSFTVIVTRAPVDEILLLFAYDIRCAHFRNQYLQDDLKSNTECIIGFTVVNFLESRGESHKNSANYRGN